MELAFYPDSDELLELSELCPWKLYFQHGGVQLKAQVRRLQGLSNFSMAIGRTWRSKTSSSVVRALAHSGNARAPSTSEWRSRLPLAELSTLLNRLYTAVKIPLRSSVAPDGFILGVTSGLSSHSLFPWKGSRLSHINSLLVS